MPSIVLTNRILRLALFLLLLCGAETLACAEEPQDLKPADVKVVRVFGSVNVPNFNQAGLGDRITVEVEPKPGRAGDSERIPGFTDEEARKLVLYLNGLQLKGLYPEAIDGSVHTLTYYLERKPQSDDSWYKLLEQPDSFLRRVSVSVGLEDQSPIATDFAQSGHEFYLIMIKKGIFFVCLAIIGGTIFLLLLLAQKSEILRTSGPKPEGGPSPYSLALSQMAFWFCLVMSSFLIIWLITGDFATITGSVLGLIGISAGTALGATLIDVSKQSSDKPPVIQPSRGFLRDVLSDGAGVSLHRFQIFVWTIVLGVIFCVEVFKDLAMPDFNATLLALMGISAGTYLGFKFPEGQTSKELAESAKPS
jgi:hypothetical protein